MSCCGKIRLGAVGLSQAVTGYHTVEVGIREERLFICSQCEMRSRNGLLAVCRVCGCLIKAKTRLRKSKCDLGKWDTVEVNND